MSNHKLNTIGILGGMGPEAALYFYKKILKLTPAKKDQDHIPTLIYSNPQIPDRTKALFSQNQESLLKALQHSVKLLEKGKVSFIVIPCNTAHYWIKQMRQEVEIPIINMVEETILKMVKSNLKKVGLLGTLGTLKSQIYQKTGKRKIDILIPPDNACQQVMTIIAEVKNGNKSESLRNSILSIVKWFGKQGISKVVLGCTELPLLFEGQTNLDWLVDPMEILAEIAVKKAIEDQT